MAESPNCVFWRMIMLLGKKRNCSVVIQVPYSNGIASLLQQQLFPYRCKEWARSSHILVRIRVQNALSRAFSPRHATQLNDFVTKCSPRTSVWYCWRSWMTPMFVKTALEWNSWQGWTWALPVACAIFIRGCMHRCFHGHAIIINLLDVRYKCQSLGLATPWWWCCVRTLGNARLKSTSRLERKSPFHVFVMWIQRRVFFFFVSSLKKSNFLDL
jgi:hypothetical protein